MIWSDRLPQARTPAGLSLRQRLGFGAATNLYWSYCQYRNFGDWIAPLLFREISGQTPSFFRQDCRHVAACFHLTVGSILHHLTLPDRAIVWGSGIIHRQSSFARPRRVCALRGPLSARRMEELGYETTDTYGDPAILLPDFIAPHSGDRAKVGLIPHYVDFDRFAERYRDHAEVVVIDVRQSVAKVVQDITACECTLSTSLHGLIVSHAYDVPSAWVASPVGLTGDDVKFQDYFASIGVPAQEPVTLTLRETADQLARISFDAPGGERQRRLRAPLRAACPFNRAAAQQPAAGTK